MSLTIWFIGAYNPAATRRLREGVGAHRLIESAFPDTIVGRPGHTDPALAEADVGFGQPPVGDLLRSPRWRWMHISTAGYSRYDTVEVREALRARSAIVTNTSSVYADPCAQHVLAMILGLGRNLLPAYRFQQQDHSWRYAELRFTALRLTGATVLLLGFGAIGRRLTELLAPFRCTIYAVRRQTRSEPGVRVIPEAELTRVLPLADHIVNILPDNEATRGWVNARRLACCRPGARFYNIGRGTTVDEKALLEALRSGRLGAAYLDVTEVEPLPPSDPLWSAPNCYITPHLAGGRKDQDEAVVEHFLANLAAFERGQPLADRVI